MPNNLVFNNTASELKTQIYGNNAGNVVAVAVDANGNFILGTLTAIVSAGTVTVSGGTIDTVQALTAGTVTIQGGTIDTVQALTAGTVTIEGGTIDTIQALTAGTVTIQGGTIDIVQALTAGTVTIQGGTIDTVQALTAGTVTIQGGTIDAVQALTAGTVTIQGGTIQAMPFFTSTDTTIAVTTASVDALTLETATQKVYSFYVANVGGANTITALLMISPTNANATYFVTDSSTQFTIGPTGAAVLIPMRFLRYTKLQLIASGPTSALCYFNAQS